MSKLLKTNKDVYQFIKYLIALRSEKYTQSFGRFQTAPDCYCTLGVALVAVIPKEELVFNPETTRLAGICSIENQQPNAPDWLMGLDTNVKLKTGKYLWRHNDSRKLTFSDIADLLENAYLSEIEEVLNVPNNNK